MQLYSEGNNYKLFQGDMLDLLEVIDENSIDAVLTDPPYELNFMGKGWDNSGIAFRKDTWEKCLKALKPGGYLLAFGGSRTHHRIACAIEDAGFEIRDCIMRIFGSGFPKSMNLGKSIESKLLNGTANPKDFKDLDGEKVETGNWGISKMVKEQGARPSDYTEDKHLRVDKVNYKTELGKKYEGRGTCLKPAYEPIIVARKPLEGSCTDNVIKYGVGGINIDECRIGTETIVTNGKGNQGNIRLPKSNEALNTEHVGRFPANTILTYSDEDYEEVCGNFPETKSGSKMSFGSVRKAQPDNCYQLGFSKHENGGQTAPDNYGDSGSACRYFYCAKASRRDRDEGLPEGERSTHPTIKPTSLMQYLVRLVTPNGGTVLDPFNGSGSTGKAVMYENKDRNKNYKYIGIELTEEYLPISKARIEYAAKQEQPPILFSDFAGYDEKNFTD